MISLLGAPRIRAQYFLTVNHPKVEAERTVATTLETQGFVTSRDSAGLIADRGEKNDWWREGLHSNPRKLELLPIQARVEIVDALGGSIVRLTLIDRWEGGVRAGAAEVYAPCFEDVVNQMSQGARLTRIFAEPTGATGADAIRSARLSGRNRAFLVLGLSVAGLTIIVMFLETLLRTVISLFSSSPHR